MRTLSVPGTFDGAVRPVMLLGLCVLACLAAACSDCNEKAGPTNANEGYREVGSAIVSQLVEAVWKENLPEKAAFARVAVEPSFVSSDEVGRRKLAVIDIVFESVSTGESTIDLMSYRSVAFWDIDADRSDYRIVGLAWPVAGRCVLFHATVLTPE